MTAKPENPPALFLDVDGVLNCRETWNLDDGQTGTFRICPDRVALLEDVALKTGPHIVMSSTWRKYPDHMDYLFLRAPWIKAYLHEDWRTPELRGFRGDEIKDWLDRHPETTRYVIVDDDADMRPEQMPCFVNTDFQNGLTADHAASLTAMLTERKSNG